MQPCSKLSSQCSAGCAFLTGDVALSLRERAFRPTISNILPCSQPLKYGFLALLYPAPELETSVCGGKQSGVGRGAGALSRHHLGQSCIHTYARRQAGVHHQMDTRRRPYLVTNGRLELRPRPRGQLSIHPSYRALTQNLSTQRQYRQTASFESFSLQVLAKRSKRLFRPFCTPMSRPIAKRQRQADEGSAPHHVTSIWARSFSRRLRHRKC